MQNALVSGTNTYTFTYSSGNSSQYFKIVAYNGSTISPLSEAHTFHGGGGTTLSVLRQRAGREMRDMVTATTIATTNTTQFTVSDIDFTKRANSYFVNHFVNNTTRGIVKPITGWTQSTGVGTHATITAQDAGDTIEVTRRFTPTEYRDAINWAITEAYPRLSRQIVYEGIETAANLYQYAIPQDIRTVDKVEIESANNASSTVEATRGHPWSDVPFVPIRTGLTMKIELEREYTASRRLRITGTGPLEQLYNDSDYVEVLTPTADIIVYMTCQRLYEGLANEAASGDVDRYNAQAARFAAKADKALMQHAMPRAARRIWSHEVRGGGGQRGGIGSWSVSS